MNTRCPPKRVPSAARFFTLCRLTVQPPQSYSIGGQRSSGQLTGKPAGARPDHQGSLVRVPLPVSDLTVLPKSTTELHVNWTVPSGCNTGFIVSYNQTNAEPKKITTNQTFAILTDLTPGTVYEVTVKTESNGKESSPVSSTGITLLDCTAQKWTVTETSIDVEAAGPIEKVTCIQSDSQESQRAATGNLRAGCTGLSPGCSYDVSIWVQDQIVCTEPQSLNAPPVTNLQVSPKSTSELAVNWADTRGCVKGYRVSVNDTHIKDINGNVTSTVIEKLDPGCLYIIKVTTIANGNDSTPVYKTGTTIPSPVSDLTVLPNSTTELHVSWRLPSGCNTGFIVSYNETNAQPKKITTNQTFVNITDLTPGTVYEVTVKTESSGKESSPVSSTGITYAPPVTNLQVSPKSTSELAVNWADTPGCVKGYRVSANDTHIEDINGNVTSTVIEKLDPGCLYIIKVTTTANGNDSTPVYKTGTTNPNAPVNLTSSEGTTTAHVSWSAPSSDVNYQNYTYLLSWSSSNLKGELKVINETSASLNDLIPGSLYNVSVRSQIGEAQSVGESQSILTDPLPPTHLLVSDESETEAVLKWGDPASGGYSGFQIFYSDTNSLTAMNSVNQDVRQYKLTNLTPGEFYNISLRSFKTEASIRKNSTEEKTNFRTVPAQVSSLQCSAVSGGYSLSLDWGNPAGRWTEIEVDVSNGDIKKVEECGPVQCETRIDGLSPARYYTLAVTTVSGEKRSFKAISIQCQTDTTGVIVGSLFGILILICLVVFLVLFILRRYPDLRRPIEVSKFADYFHRQQADSDIGFADEYQSLSAVGTEQTTKAALTPENRGKNRFTNVLPYDWCRVKLSAIDGEPFSDYINANYMPGYHTAKEFIAAQGPLPNTVEDFWRMAWENQVEAIVMLTNCIENTKVKCEQYWPLDYTPCTYGDISVTTSSEQKQPDWTLRDFTLKHTKSSESRTVKQFHFTAWPDHGVPDNTATLIQFRALVRKFLDNRERNGPAIVHCSAGVGRTGTLIALDSLLLQIEREKAVGIQSFVQKMRLHRPLMVQTEVSPAQRPDYNPHPRTIKAS
ncbi:UNVERIFIED_CONTAM: hypothetical protein FKN15_003719 [Acipenser sinensis]